MFRNDLHWEFDTGMMVLMCLTQPHPVLFQFHSIQFFAAAPEPWSGNLATWVQESYPF
jgi:hypothetical protein